MTVSLEQFKKIKKTADELVKKYKKDDLITLATNILYHYQRDNEIICSILDKGDIRLSLNKDLEDNQLELIISRIKDNLNEKYIDSFYEIIEELKTEEDFRFLTEED